jgi:hypothetical protein
MNNHDKATDEAMKQCVIFSCFILGVHCEKRRRFPVEKEFPLFQVDKFILRKRVKVFS